MTEVKGAVIDPLRAAREDYDAVVKLTRELVRVPSRGGIDPYDPVLECMAARLGEHGLASCRLPGPGGATAALACEVPGGGPGPRYVLDACLDTAPFGDEAAWTYPPASGEIADGWLYGRGLSDSKAGAAIFAHVAARLRDTAGGFGGSVVLLFDVDEHTGGFGGAKAYFEGAGGARRVDGVMIGYPGLDYVVTGGRGVLRARVHVHGIAGHSGSSRTGAGAIAKAAHLIRELHVVPLPGPAGPEFPQPAKLTVTAVSGGEGYSMVPDLCTFNVDIRLTPALDDPAAVALLRAMAADIVRHGRAPRLPVLRSPPGGRRTRCRTARRCATRCLRQRPGRGWPLPRRSPGRPTSETIWHGWVSLLPPGLASTTGACTALTSAFA